MKGNPNSLGTLALIATAALWGSNHVVARAARDAIPLPALVFWRWLPAAIILTIIALPALRDAWPAVRPRLAGIVVGGAIGVGLFSYLLLGGAFSQWCDQHFGELRFRQSKVARIAPLFDKLLPPRRTPNPLVPVIVPVLTIVLA